MPSWDDQAARLALRRVFDAAIDAADPRLTLAAHLPPKPKGRCIVVGAGKASALMAAALEAAWPDVELSGLIVTRYGHAVPTKRVEVMEAGHPVPDHNSELAARRIIAMVAGLTEDDLVLALMSGGGSALLTLPGEGITLADKQAINLGLLRSGTQIHEMNAVRKHLSSIKGGRLALAARPATVVTLAISDVPGDDFGVIASGPTVPDITTLRDVDDILRTSGIPVPANVARYLEGGHETPKPGDFPVDARLIATPMMALRAAASTARGLGLTALILGDALEGESRVLGQAMAGIALSVARHGEPLARPAVLLSGGETTVTLGEGPHGRGGRNMEFVLALALALNGEPNIWAVAGDSDGIDGIEAAAGAIVTPDTLARARRAQCNPANMLRNHDSFHLFKELSDLVITGPTLTNVNDIRAVLIA
jgi:glycerate 2-kinase